MSKFIDDGMAAIDAALAAEPFSATPEFSDVRAVAAAILGYLHAFSHGQYREEDCEGDRAMSNDMTLKSDAEIDHMPLVAGEYETKTYSDGTSASGPPPLPDLSPEQQAQQERLNKVNPIADEGPIDPPPAAA